MRHLVLMLKRVLPAMLASACVAASSAAQDSARAHAAHPATYRDRLLGVFDAATGESVQNAEVVDMLSGTSALTSRTGTVTLGFLPVGGGLVRIRKLGYAMRTMMVEIAPADTAPVTVVLQPAVQLPGVTTFGTTRYISPNLRGFEDRRLHGASGYFITDSVLRKEEARPFGNVLESHIPGIIIRHSGSQELLEKSRRCTNGGTPDVYLDGVKLKHPPPADPGLMLKYMAALRADPGSAAQFPFDLSAFQVTSLAGVEYYPDNAMAPLQFEHTTRGCGLLLLWTREK